MGKHSDLRAEMTYFTLVLVEYYVTLARDGGWELLTVDAVYVWPLLGIIGWYCLSKERCFHQHID